MIRGNNILYINISYLKYFVLILDLYGQCSLILPGKNTGLSSSFKIFDEQIEKGNPGVNGIAFVVMSNIFSTKLELLSQVLRYSLLPLPVHLTPPFSGRLPQKILAQDN